MHPFGAGTEKGRAIDPQGCTLGFIRAVGKGEAGVSGHSLPVVAVGSIPHIYRRAGHAPGDPN